jgi:hypothetical protein
LGLWDGVEHACLGTYSSPEKLAQNHRMFIETAGDPIYRPPWSSEQEERDFLEEMKTQYRSANV